MEKMEELQTELNEREIDPAIITETKEKNNGSDDIGNYIIILFGVQ